MDANTGQKASFRDYLAAERTLLAWIRTGLALTGVGFVVARFGFFLHQMEIMRGMPSEWSYGPSLWFGTALIIVGVLVNLFSGWHHVRLLRALDAGATSSARPPTQAVVVAFFLAAVGLGMAINLFSVENSTGLNSGKSKEKAMSLSRGNGIIDIPSSHSVDLTVEKLKGFLKAKGVSLFALVDHSGEAGKAGMKMRPTKLLIFGSPKGRHSSDAGFSQRRH